MYGDPENTSADRGILGERQSHRNSFLLCDEGKRCCAETLFFDYYRQHKLRIKVAWIFNTYGPRMHPNDGRVVSNFIVQALKGGHHGLWNRSADEIILLCGRLDRCPDQVDGHPR